MLLDIVGAITPADNVHHQKANISKCPFMSEWTSPSQCPMKLTNYITGKQSKDTLYSKSKQPIACNNALCKGALMSGQSNPPEVHRNPVEILNHARDFLQQYFTSLKSSSSEDLEKRMKQVTDEVSSTGTYELTYDELVFGAKLAWRNAPRCIGRIQWNKLEVQDCRKIKSTKEMFDALCNHLTYATNGGNLRSMITVFPPRAPGCEDFRLWNPQLINFAGYLKSDGSVIGDPGRVQFTRVCQRLGWKGKGGHFDILPWVMTAPGEGPAYYDIPEEIILMVNLEHPRFPWFAEMGLRWYAVPAVADMMLDLGGIAFPAAPFNGWYMGTEIGARNLCDPHRYNLSDVFAEKMGLDTSSSVTLWKDTVLVEVNIAILYSYRKNQVTIVDHHTASETFMKHMSNEQRLRGGCPADWVWIVPPMSGSATEVFHQEMINYNLKPSFEYQKKAWMTYKWPKRTDVRLKYKLSSIARAAAWCIALMAKRRTARVLTTVLYATETGKSETFARRLERLLQASFNVRVICMEEYDIRDLQDEKMLFIVASTFGSGEPPDNGKGFWSQLKKMHREKRSLSELKYAVFALGSSQYPNYCNFGKNVDKTLNLLGAERMVDVKCGDELRGQEHTFNSWLPDIYQISCKSYGLHASAKDLLPLVDSLSRWKKDAFRLSPASYIAESSLFTDISSLHKKTTFPLKLLTKVNLQARHSENKTILVTLGTNEPSLLKYEPGDHLGVFPTNPKAIVNVILAKLKETGHDVDETVKIENLKGDSWKKFARLPAASIKTCLKAFLDITSPPTPHFLDLLSELASGNWDKYRLKRLAKVSDDYEEWQSYKAPNLAELLHEFPSVVLDPTLLLTELPLLQPRYYSISSSHQANPGQVHLTVSLVTYRTQDGKGPIHNGVCTSYLNDFPDEDVPCFVRKAQGFHMPQDKSLPIIMIGAGSGVAPFRSFWQQREIEMKASVNKESLGEMVLFFGCRQPHFDNIYESETVPLLRKNVLSKLFTAFSREPGKPKRYVQHEILAQSDLVWKLISEGGHVYVCGDAMMASDVKSTLDSILREKLGKDIDDLMDSGRYHEDVFGILRRTK